jgi:MinD superfamily P-loop ATPase
MISETRYGPLVHARLGVAAENSGKLVFTVRKEARRIASEEKYPLIIVDGPPGIGCPVIASITGASLVLIVTEPTVSGEHDLARVLSLSKHFRIPAAICINKWDLNQELTERMETEAVRSGAFIAGRVRYDPGVTRAQINAQSVVEAGGAAAEDVVSVWETISEWRESA